MAGLFATIGFDPQKARVELDDFDLWLEAHTSFGEKEVVKEIRSRPQMACLLGYTIVMPAPDLLKFEFPLIGAFRADLVVGNHASRKFVLVEFEDGRDNSLFKGGPSQYRHWSDRLEHGFGQVIDWAWLKQSHAQSPLLRSNFGGRIAVDCYVVVCGRSPAGGSLEEERFDFRRRMGITGIDFQLFTYDDMVNAMRDNVTALTAI